jgi:signal transduction histidine kinase
MSLLSRLFSCLDSGLGPMRWLLYLRLFYLTAGTLLPFFWMVVILGHRRQRDFERIFFFLCLALVCFFGSSLLALNARLYYERPPRALMRFAWTWLCLGLWLVPPFLQHMHAEFAALRELIHSRQAKTIWLAAAYLPALLPLPKLIAALRASENFDFERPTRFLGPAFQIWLVVSIAVSAFWQWRFSRLATSKEERSLYDTLKWMFTALAVVLLLSLWLQERFRPDLLALIAPLLLVVTIAGPFLKIIEQVNRFNFLAIGRQRNLIYAVFLTFIAVLYLSLVRRVSLWLDLYLPPEATAAFLLFLPVVFFEPLQRVMRQLLRQTAQTEVDRAQRLMGPINETARLGDLGELTRFAERWIAEQLQLAEVQISPNADEKIAEKLKRSQGNSEEFLEIRRGAYGHGYLLARSHGAMISGETYAALEMVCEQLPAAFDLCRLIHEKLQLDRELAERERLALVGQMAASISHNLKNPLGSIKTILQVQMESPDLPNSLRNETQMVLDEINRLSAKLNQLLQFSRPGVSLRRKEERCNVLPVAANVVEVLRHEAEPGGIALAFSNANGAYEVAATSETVNDILSNVVLNAIEAVGRGGNVHLGVHCEQQACTVAVEDDGPGIPTALKEKILRPFFTTKARGTGLGLAIVVRRLEEIGGRLEIDSPIRDDRGSRFRVILPLAPKDQRK